MRTVRRHPRSVVLLSVGVWSAGIAVAGCSVSESLPMPDCEDGGSMLIAAQSVPSADHVICLGSLPEGWDVESVSVTQAGTRIDFDSDRAGVGAATLRYDERCDIADAVAAPSDQPGTDRYDRIEALNPGFAGQVFYTFTGGCVWWTFDFDDDAPAALAIELNDRLQLIDRGDYNDAVRESFLDEDF